MNNIDINNVDIWDWSQNSKIYDGMWRIKSKGSVHKAEWSNTVLTTLWFTSTLIFKNYNLKLQMKT